MGTIPYTQIIVHQRTDVRPQANGTLVRLQRDAVRTLSGGEIVHIQPRLERSLPPEIFRNHRDRIIDHHTDPAFSRAKRFVFGKSLPVYPIEAYLIFHDLTDRKNAVGRIGTDRRIGEIVRTLSDDTLLVKKPEIRQPVCIEHRIGLLGQDQRHVAPDRYLLRSEDLLHRDRIGLERYRFGKFSGGIAFPAAGAQSQHAQQQKDRIWFHSGRLLVLTR